jgi:sec-independent protein translocase protein TatC
VFGIILLLTCVAFIDIKDLVKILELPVSNVKFFQLSPGEYFISTIKISFVFSSPFVIGQVNIIFITWLTPKERQNYFTLLLSSLFYLIGASFLTTILVPAANFFCR